MKSIFVDTSGWGAWADSSDRDQLTAVSIFNQLWDEGATFVTSSWVLLELSALFNHFRFDKTKQIQFFDNLQVDPSISIRHVRRQQEAAAWKLWRSRLDKSWTVTDCSSFILMSELKITEVITADHHFTQTGFVKPLTN